MSGVMGVMSDLKTKLRWSVTIAALITSQMCDCYVPGRVRTAVAERYQMIKRQVAFGYSSFAYVTHRLIARNDGIEVYRLDLSRSLLGVSALPVIATPSANLVWMLAFIARDVFFVFVRILSASLFYCRVAFRALRRMLVCGARRGIDPSFVGLITSASPGLKIWRCGMFNSGLASGFSSAWFTARCVAARSISARREAFNWQVAVAS